MIEPSRASRNFSATAAPAANACPCPKGPEEFSIPRNISTSGCPGVAEPHCRNAWSSSKEKYPRKANAA